MLFSYNVCKLTVKDIIVESVKAESNFSSQWIRGKEGFNAFDHFCEGLQDSGSPFLPKKSDTKGHRKVNQENIKKKGTHRPRYEGQREKQRRNLAQYHKSTCQ